jgi:hypothetical protein
MQNCETRWNGLAARATVRRAGSLGVWHAGSGVGRMTGSRTRRRKWKTKRVAKKARQGLEEISRDTTYFVVVVCLVQSAAGGKKDATE